MTDQFNQSIRALVDEFASRLTAECKKQLAQGFLEDMLRQMGQTISNGGNPPAPPAVQPAPHANSSTVPSAPGAPQTAPGTHPVIMPPPAPETPPTAAQTPSEPPSSGRRTRAQLECIAEELTALLKRRKGGLRMEELQHELGIASSDLEIPVRMALNYGWVKKRGQRRGTVYYIR